MIDAVIIDKREPAYIKALTFGGDVPVLVDTLETGDIQVLCKDGSVLLIERKTTDDLLGSLSDGRLWSQGVRMASTRVDEQIAGRLITWPYLLIQGSLTPSADGNTVADGRQTGFSWRAIQAALLSLQEIGVFVLQTENVEATVVSLSKRSRGIMTILPARPALMLGPGGALLASLPGIGVERVKDVLNWSDNRPGLALSGITDLDIPCPLPRSTREKIRATLSLAQDERLEIYKTATPDGVPVKTAIAEG